jgi:hypothetical protein
MDVEGCEYEFLNGVNLNICATTFDQIVMEVHGLIEEIPEGWIIEAAIQNAKNNLQKKCEFFEKLNNHFHLIHIHGNNHSPRYVDFPDSLELTYINRNLFNKRRICKQRCPDPLLDQPNFDGRAEYVLDYWI